MRIDIVPRIIPLALAPLLIVLTSGCVSNRLATAPEVHVSHLPPDETDILEALFRSEAIPLSVHPLCQEIAGTDRDQTIGRYFAGLLATHTPGHQNSISVAIDEADPDGDWIASVVSSSGDAGDPYYWGLEFRVRRSDGLVIPSSFRCFIPWW